MKDKFWVKEYGATSNRVVFLFGGWKYRGYMILPVAKLLAANEYHCIAYWYDDGIFTPNHSQTKDNLLKVCDNAIARAGELTMQGKEVYAICGASLGAMCAIIVANALPQVHKVVLNTVGADVAGAVWHWDVRTNKHFKQDLLDQGLDLHQLAESWRAISPIRNISNFAGKHVLVYLAERDKVIPYELGRELVNELRAKGATCQVETNRYLNHAGANAYNFARSSKYLKFLNQIEKVQV